MIRPVSLLWTKKHTHQRPVAAGQDPVQAKYVLCTRLYSSPRFWELTSLIILCSVSPRSQSVVEPGVLKRPDKVKSEEDNMQPLLSLDWRAHPRLQKQLEIIPKSRFTHTNTPTDPLAKTLPPENSAAELGFLFLNELTRSKQTQARRTFPQADRHPKSCPWCSIYIFIYLFVKCQFQKTVTCLNNPDPTEQGDEQTQAERVSTRVKTEFHTDV